MQIDDGNFSSLMFKVINVTELGQSQQPIQ